MNSDKKQIKEHIKTLIQLALLKSGDADKHTLLSNLIGPKIEILFEIEFEKPDFLVRLGFFLVELGLYPERFQTGIGKD